MSVTGKRKRFLLLLCDRIPPYDACRKVWPQVKDVHSHINRITNDPEFKEAYNRLTSYQSSPEQLIMDCRRIIDDEEAANDNRLTAIRVIASMKGYIKLGGHVVRPRQAVPIDDDTLVRKMAELGQKAYKGEKENQRGHSQKPS